MARAAGPYETSLIGREGRGGGVSFTKGAAVRASDIPLGGRGGSELFWRVAILKRFSPASPRAGLKLAPKHVIAEYLTTE